MQIAHPLVGRAIAEHSDFQKRPIRRLLRTLDSTYDVIFGAQEESVDGARRINQAHRPVEGVLHEAVGIFPAGTPYSARDPELAQWIWGTLVDSAIPVYERFVRPLSGDYKEEYYQEAKAILGRAGGKPKDAPATYNDFTAYMDGMHQNGALIVADDAKELAPHILLQTSPLTRAASRPVARVAVGLLREPLRGQYAEVLEDKYGFSIPEERNERYLDTVAQISRSIHPYLPDVVRFSPKYRRARRQVE
jgi:uncharacterized protein (DUF2236 family)